MNVIVCQIGRVRDASVKTGCGKVWNVRPFFGRSVMRSREARAARSGFSRLNGLSFWLSRIGSVIREQRPAAATTRKSCCSLNAGESSRRGRSMGGANQSSFGGASPTEQTRNVTGRTRQHSENAASRIATRPALDAESGNVNLFSVPTPAPGMKVNEKLNYVQ
jgi:hypothetical protein